MGVPAFYRWLSDRYPKIMIDALEEEPEYMGATAIPLDLTQPNLNGIHIDNLYLDMNGIIHPCFHPEDSTPPTTESEIFQNIFDYIDRLVAVVRPRRLLYLAIDGVAPRAKMNQQRSRRFKAAKERLEHAAIEAEMREKLRLEGIQVQVVHGLETDHGDTFDSNVITPGTEFMDRLAKALQWYVHERLNSQLGWGSLAVILSDSNTPGEGEHKFMQFVREQRDIPGWNSNTVHCIYGMDADLIHLALASHEPHFYILRDVITYTKNMAGNARKNDMDIRINIDENRTEIKAGAGPDAKVGIKRKPFQYMRISVLRDYLKLEFQDLQAELQFPFDGERIVDDFVFMCFFVGNDFLPHMPTLDIREEGIELMLHVYRKQLPQLDGYLCSGSELHLDRVEQFIVALGSFEDRIFLERDRRHMREKEKYERRKADMLARREADEWERNAPLEDAAKNVPDEGDGGADARHGAAAGSRQKRKAGGDDGDGDQPSKRGNHSGDGKGELKQLSKEEFDELLKTKKKSVSDMFEKMVADVEKIRLGKKGWHRRYYEEKFGVKQQQGDGTIQLPNRFQLETDDDFSDLIAGLRKSYVEGLQWVMHYYYSGVASWRWYYPYHYAPFASDLIGMKDLKATFEPGEPFDPLNQLMGVFPPASAHAVPEPLRRLFAPNSQIADFYPEKVETDMNGKRYAWQGVELLSFIDEDRLLEQTNPIIATLPDTDRKRNERRSAMLLVRTDTDAGEVVARFASSHMQANLRHLQAQRTDHSQTVFQHLGFSGKISRSGDEDPCPECIRPPEFGTFGTKINENLVVRVCVDDPTHKVHRCEMLSSAPPENILNVVDLPTEKPLWCLRQNRGASQPANMMGRRDADQRQGVRHRSMNDGFRDRWRDRSPPGPRWRDGARDRWRDGSPPHPRGPPRDGSRDRRWNRSPPGPRDARRDGRMPPGPDDPPRDGSRGRWHDRSPPRHPPERRGSRDRWGARSPPGRRWDEPGRRDRSPHGRRFRSPEGSRGGRRDRSPPRPARHDSRERGCDRSPPRQRNRFSDRSPGRFRDRSPPGWSRTDGPCGGHRGAPRSSRQHEDDRGNGRRSTDEFDRRRGPPRDRRSSPAARDDECEPRGGPDKGRRGSPRYDM